MAKAKTAIDEKFEKQDFDLFEAISAIDKKDYNYYDRLTTEQQKKFVPYMIILWVSAVKGNRDLQAYYLQSTEYHANKYLLNEVVSKNPKLQWLMLCAASPGLGKHMHQWIPHIKDKVSKLKEVATEKEMFAYYKKIYNADDDLLNDLSKLFVAQQTKKVYLAEEYPELKLSDIEVLSEIVTQDMIDNHERQKGNI